MQGEIASAHGRAAGPAVGLDHVAVDVHRSLAESRQVDDRPQAAADEALDLDGTPSCLPRTASRGVRSRVELGSSEYSAVSHPAPLPRRQPGTPLTTWAEQRTRVPPSSRSTDPSAVLHEVRGDLQAAHLSGPPRTDFASLAHICVTSRMGSCRKRMPTSLNSSLSPVAKNR